MALRAVVSGDDVLKLFTSAVTWSCVEGELRGDEEDEGKDEEEGAKVDATSLPGPSQGRGGGDVQR